jgi:hypothetical protein
VAKQTAADKTTATDRYTPQIEPVASDAALA